MIIKYLYSSNIINILKGAIRFFNMNLQPTAVKSTSMKVQPVILI